MSPVYASVTGGRGLGKKPYVQDPRTIQLTKYTGGATDPSTGVPLPVVPVPPVTTWGAVLNDTIGCCTISAAVHIQMAAEAQTGKPVTPLGDPQTLAAYEAVSGYRPDDSDTDHGAEIKTVLSYWRKTGIGGQTIAAYAELGSFTPAYLRTAISMLGSVDIGVLLPLAVQDTTTWAAPPASAYKAPKWWWPFGQKALHGAWAPGSWGGHCVPLVGYDDVYFYAISWGQVIAVEPEFLAAYIDEAWAVLTPDILTGGKTPAGLDVAQLRADIQALAT